MNDEIFRRAAIAKSLAEIDLDAADPRNALDSCKLRFAILQRAMRPVAFACDLLEMLPQPFRGRGFGKQCTANRSNR